MRICTVTVIGVTGTMGANIAGIFASFGNAKVYCVGRSIETVKMTIPRIVKSVRADAISKNLIPVDLEHLEECVACSDLVFESTKEDMDVKKRIASRIAKVLKPNAISGTGTSGLSVTSISECYPLNLRGNFFGIHMFNPPYVMQLCELTSTKYSSTKVKDDLKRYLRDTLFRTVVEVKDSPGFLGNRIGFQFINETLQYAEKYKDNGGIDYIDAILGTFTGRSMPPLVTADFVGLDVHKAIVENIYNNTDDYAHDTFVLPSFVRRLLDEGCLGRKSGIGLYQHVRYQNGLCRRTVFDISSGMYRDTIPYVFPFAEKMKTQIAEGNYVKAFEFLINNQSLEAEICLSFLLKYIVYSIYAGKHVGFSIDAADDVMATGFNWCPPLALFHALSAIVDVAVLIKTRLSKICSKVDVDELLSDVKITKYDYRAYFKSGM